MQNKQQAGVETTFLRRMQDFITEEQLLMPNSTVCCALSGGADSVALLLGMLSLRDAFSLTVTAVHINHHLRGAESDRDAQFCAALCQRLHVPLHIRHCDVKARQASTGGSIETVARECRYEIFAAETGLLATAHTASDNLETVLQRLVRGTGLHGLTGIPVRRGKIIRPLLFASRQEVEAFLQSRREAYVTDSTNASDAYTRNRIRHQIVPVLQAMNPSVAHTVLQMCRTLRQDDQYFAQEVNAAFAAHVQEPDTLQHVSEMPESVRVRCLQRLLERKGISGNAQMLQTMERLAQKGGRCQLSGGFECRSSKDAVQILPQHARTQEVREMPFQLGEQCLFAGYRVTATLIADKKLTKDLIVDRNFTNHLLDYDKIKGTIVLRSRVSGDRIQLAGRDFTVSIKKQIQEKVPLHRRQTLHFLADEAGTIFAEGIGIADRVKPEAGVTQQLLVVSIEKIQQADCCAISDEEKE